MKSDARRRGELSVFRRDELHAFAPPDPTAVAWTNSEWREHGATSESLEPEPKGEGTVWQRDLIRPNRTHPNLEHAQRGSASYMSPA